MERAIVIKGTTYPLKFGIRAYRFLGREWKLNDIEAILKKIQEPFEEGKKPGNLEQFDAIGYLTWAGIKAAKVEDVPDVDDIIDDMMFDSERMEIVMTAFSENIPQVQGNPQPRKKPGKKAKK